MSSSRGGYSYKLGKLGQVQAIDMQTLDQSVLTGLYGEDEISQLSFFATTKANELVAFEFEKRLLTVIDLSTLRVARKLHVHPSMYMNEVCAPVISCDGSTIVAHDSDNFHFLSVRHNLKIFW
eukprot:GILI01016956.1.p2 GENE.GILI01016956.1~~GILI01016956.1.p2  ORF type:complete len:123 (-),score=21.45 GILI01016956.1:125-493(-)